MNHAAMSAPRLLEAFFEHSLELHVVADAQGHLLRVNPAWREVLLAMSPTGSPAGRWPI